MHPQKFSPKINILQKITNFLCGFFLGFLIFLIPLKIISSIWSAFLGIILATGACAYAINKYKNNGPKKIVTIGILASIIVIIAAYLLISALVYSIFNEISK